MIYLDNNASSRLCDEAYSAMLPWLRDNWANPSSISHRLGRKARMAVEDARLKIARSLRCNADGLVFTSGATEANALALNGARSNGSPPRRILIAKTEHVSVITAAAAAMARYAGELELVEICENGVVRAEDFNALKPAEGDLISVAWVSGETGIVNEVEDIAALAHSCGAMIHVDASQAMGRLPIDLTDMDVDYMTFSGHKAHGPKGIGLLAVKANAELDALWTGGSQEARRRGGTENVPGIVGFGAAVEIISRQGRATIEGITALRHQFEGRLKAGSNCVVVGENVQRAANTSMLAWPRLSNTEILSLLDRRGVYASAGSACSSATEGISLALRALKLPIETISGSVRFSLSRETHEAEIDKAVRIIVDVVRTLS